MGISYKRSFLGLVTLLAFCGGSFRSLGQQKTPFHLPTLIPVPEWVKRTDWSAPNVNTIDSLMSAFKEADEAALARVPSPLAQRDNQDPDLHESPYVVAYIRWRNKMKPFIQPNGTIKYDPGYHRAQLTKSINEHQNAAFSGKNARTTSAANWTFLGPVQTYTDNGRGLINEQSNIYCMAIAPSNPSVLYASSEPGFMYRSTDKGLHWTSVSDSLYSCEASTIAVDPTNANIVYCYDAMSNTILKTSDAGTTWTALTSYYGNGGDRMVIAPGTGRILITGDTMVYYSDNAGASWTRAIGTGAMTDIALDPMNADTVYAAGANSTGNLIILRSVDGGAHFSNVGGSLGTINTGGARLGVTKANSNYVYCANIGGTSAPRIIKSTDRGNSWAITAVSTDSTSLTGNSDTTGLGMSNGQGYYDFDIVVSPRDANQVIVGTTSTYRSVDGGYNFRPLGGYNGPLFLHPDLQQAVANDTDVYLTTDGGINHSSDFFATSSNWTVRNNNLRSGEFWGFGQGWDEDIVVGGRYHNGNTALYENYGAGLGLRLGGGEDATGHVFHGYSRTTGYRDIGMVVLPPSLSQPIQYGSPLVPNSLWPSDDYYGLFSSKLMIDPRYSSTFYLGNDSILWKSTNRGSSYSALHNFGNGNKVWRFDIARSNSDVMYLCTTHNVYKTTNGGTSWTTISLPITYAYYNSDVVIDPLNENNVYLCMASADSTHKVLMSTNGGTTWTNITGNVLKYQPVAFLQFHGGTNGGVYAITNNRPSRVYYRDNTMSDWVDYSAGLPAGIEAREGGLIFYRDNKLRMAGNSSIWETPLYTTGAPVAQPMADKQFIGCSSDTVYFFDYSMYTYAGATRKWTFPGATWFSSDTVRQPKVLYGTPGSYNVSLKVTNAAGQTNTRTINNMITYNSTLCGPDTVAGTCIRTDGTGRTISLGNVPINSNTFSISCWVQPHGAQSSFSQMVSHDVYPGSGGFGFGMGFTFDGYTRNLELCYTDSLASYYNTSGLVCDSTKWNFVVLTYSPTGVTMYLNGVPATVNSASMPVIDLSQSPFYINFDCVEGQGSHLNANIDEIKFYNYALTQSEVREKMHLIQSNPAAETGLLKYFQFNQYDPVSGLMHDAFGEYSVLVSATNVVTSTAPVATGTVYRNPTVNSAGANNFAAADFALNLASGGVFPGGEVVAFHLRSNPDTHPDTRSLVPGYFVVNNYGTATTFTHPDSITFSNLKITTPLAQPGNFRLFQRPGGAFGNTWGAELDSAVTFNYAAGHSALTYGPHNGIVNLFSQLAIVSNSRPLGVSPVTQPENQWQISELYPNPAAAWSKIDLHAPALPDGEATFTITNLQGQQLLRFSQRLDRIDNTVMFHLPKLAAGSYLLHVEIPQDGGVVRKFVVE